MNRIRDARKASKMSQRDVAERLGVTQPTLSGWESDKYPIDSTNLTTLCELFSVTPNYLLGIDDDTDIPIVVKPELEGAYIAFNNGDVEPITQEELDLVTQALLKARRQNRSQGNGG